MTSYDPDSIAAIRAATAIQTAALAGDYAAANLVIGDLRQDVLADVVRILSLVWAEATLGFCSRADMQEALRLDALHQAQTEERQRNDGSNER